jgi:hypothetical protein
MGIKQLPQFLKLNFMNILLIDSSLKDGQYMSSYLKLRGHQCEWLRKLDEGQPTNGVVSGLDSGWHERKLSLTDYNLALIEAQLFNTKFGVEFAVKLAKANIIRVAVGGIEGSAKLTELGVFNFVVNRATFFAKVDEILAGVGGLVFEATRQKSNRTLIARATEVFRKLKRFRRKATK